MSRKRLIYMIVTLALLGIVALTYRSAVDSSGIASAGPSVSSDASASSNYGLDANDAGVGVAVRGQVNAALTAAESNDVGVGVAARRMAISAAAIADSNDAGVGVAARQYRETLRAEGWNDTGVGAAVRGGK